VITALSPILDGDVIPAIIEGPGRFKTVVTKKKKISHIGVHFIAD